MKQESGFTLVELLTAIVIIGVLSGISIRSFSEYRAKATYQVAVSTLSDGRKALEAALIEPDTSYSSVALLSQTSPGPMTNPAAAALLPGLNLPKNLKVRFSYDTTCTSAACGQAFLQANHCAGTEFIRWQRFGDGTEFLTENLAGSGCP